MYPCLGFRGKSILAKSHKPGRPEKFMWWWRDGDDRGKDERPGTEKTFPEKLEKSSPFKSSVSMFFLARVSACGAAIEDMRFPRNFTVA
jgi:hypothetical protein